MYIKGSDVSLEDYAKRYYFNPHCVDYKEFLEDVDRIKYIKRLLRRYINKGELRESLIIRHLVILNNIFPPEPLSNMLFGELEQSLHSSLKSFLEFMHILPKQLDDIEMSRTDLYFLESDSHVTSILEAI